MIGQQYSVPHWRNCYVPCSRSCSNFLLAPVEPLFMKLLESGANCLIDKGDIFLETISFFLANCL